MLIDVKILSALLAASINLFLIIFLSLRNRQHTVYRSFIVICFCLLVWNLRVVMSGLLGPDNAGSFYTILITQMIFPLITACLYILPVAALQFTASFVGIETKEMQYFIRSCYLAAFALSILYVADVFTASIYDWILWLFMLPLFLASFFLIGRAYRRSQRPLNRMRLGSLFAGGTIGVAGAISEDIFTASGMPAGGLGNIANAAYSLCVAVCLLRYRLFDINVTARKGVAFVISLILIVAVAYFLSKIVGLTSATPHVYILVAVLLLLSLGPKLVPYTEKVLFVRRAIVYQTIDEIRNALDTAHNIQELCELSTEIMKKNVNVTKCHCVVRDEVTQQYRLYRPERNDMCSIVTSGSLGKLMRWMNQRRSPEPLVYDEILHTLAFDNTDKGESMELAALSENMDELGIEVCVPFIFENVLEGMLLVGEKVGGRVFTDSDMRFATLLVYNCALWLQRIRMLEKIRQLESLAALGEMAAYIAHEVKNPIAVIRSSAQLLNLNGHQGSMSDMIIDECDRLNRVVTQMLHISKAPKPHQQVINIEKVIKEWAHELSRSRASDNIELSVECANCVSNIVFDPDHLKQIVTNLLLNAIEAMKEKGRLNISISEGRDNVRVVLRDTGPGIPYEDQSSVFHLFFSTKPGGTGLGLPITRRLLELNNGTIEINSQPGKGCEVTIGLPREPGYV